MVRVRPRRTIRGVVPGIVPGYGLEAETVARGSHINHRPSTINHVPSPRCTVDIQDFKKLVVKEFGSNLEHATPANVRDFLDHMQFDMIGSGVKGRIVLEESATTFEEVLRDFFAKVLDLPRDDAIIMLWLLAFDFAFSAIEIQQSDAFNALFGEYAE